MPIIEIKYIAYVITQIEGEITNIDKSVWPPIVKLKNNEVFEINVSEKLSEEFVEKITIHATPKKKVK
jgi:hypothetical protein